MAKFVLVDEQTWNAREQVKKHYVIKNPDFIEEIKASANKMPAQKNRKLTTLYYLKEVVAHISSKYDKDFNHVSGIPYSKYEGIEFQDEKDLSEKVIIPLFKKHHPEIFYKFVDTKIKVRPNGIETVFFIGVPEDYVIKAFYDNGINEGFEEEVEKPNIDTKNDSQVLDMTKKDKKVKLNLSEQN
jgi:hypothetical protein